MVGVLDFIPLGVDSTEVLAITERLRTQLTQLQAFQVVERNQMNSILDEIGFQLYSGACDDKACVVQVGRILGASKMVAGNVSKVGTLYSITARIIDVNTSRIEFAADEFASSIEEVFRTAVVSVAQQLAGTEIQYQQRGAEARPQPRITTPTSGQITIISEPEAAIYVDNETMGATPSTLTLPSGDHQLLLRRPRYQNYEGTLFISSGMVDTVSVRLVPLPGRILFLTNPSNANLVLNGNGVGRTPLGLNLPAQAHSVRFEMSGYEPFEQTVRVAPGTTDTVSVDLGLLPARLEIRSYPSGATVFIDGEEKGIAPINLSLPPKNYRVTLEREGFRDYFETVQLVQGRTYTVSANMIRIPTRRVAIHSDPPGADILIDGTSRGTTNIASLELTLGPHTFEFRRAGYDPVIRRINVSRVTPTIKETLHRSGESRLVLNVSHRGANVDIRHRSGNHTFTAPVDTIMLRPGTCSILVTAPGYSRWRASRNLAINAVLPVTISLRPKSRIISGLLSSVFPGWGQMYAGRGTMGFLYFITEVGLGAYTYQQYDLYTKADSDYMRAARSYEEEEDQNQMGSRRDAMLDQFEKVQRTRDDLKLAASLLAGVHVLSILDSVIFMPRLPRIESQGPAKPTLRTTAQRGSLFLILTVSF